MKKVFSDAASALDGILSDNMSVAAGGFGLCGIPENLIGAIAVPDPMACLGQLQHPLHYSHFQRAISDL